MKDSIVIFSATRARQLLKAGFQIIDIKPDRKDKTHMRSVFVFRYDERIQQYLEEMWYVNIKTNQKISKFYSLEYVKYYLLLIIIYYL